MVTIKAMYNTIATATMTVSSGKEATKIYVYTKRQFYRIAHSNGIAMMSITIFCS